MPMDDNTDCFQVIDHQTISVTTIAKKTHPSQNACDKIY